ncbi:MAG: GspH/FimT family pseudopilin [Sulfuricaulis sp.]
MRTTAHKNTRPFVCQILPFVSTGKPSIFPFVGKKQPFVGNKGFTLIELIVTLTIAGILLAIAAPNMSNFIKDQRLSSQANDLIADLNLARSEAIKRGVNVTICKQNASSTTPQCDTTTADAWSAGWVTFIDSTTAGTDGQVDPSETVLRFRQALSGNNTLTSASTPQNLSTPTHDAANRIVYTVTGQTTIDNTSEANFRLCDSRGYLKAFTILINSTGRSRISQTTPSCP